MSVPQSWLSVSTNGKSMYKDYRQTSAFLYVTTATDDAEIVWDTSGIISSVNWTVNTNNIATQIASLDSRAKNLLFQAYGWATVAHVDNRIAMNNTIDSFQSGITFPPVANYCAEVQFNYKMSRNASGNKIKAYLAGGASLVLYMWLLGAYEPIAP